MSDNIQKAGFLRLPQILKLIPVCRATWWNGCRSGRFPKPVKLGPNTTAWKAKDIAALIEQLENQAEASDSSRMKEEVCTPPQ
jgi:predicted DNA-binding transcriptional regulator AlpA